MISLSILQFSNHYNIKTYSMHPQAHLNYDFQPSKRLQQQRLQMGHAQYWHAAVWGTQQLLALGTSEDAKTMENLVDVAESWVGTPSKTNVTMEKSIINWMGGARVIRYSGLGVRSVGPVGDFLEKNNQEWRWISYWKSSCVFFFSDFPGLAMLVFKGGYRSIKSVVDT